VRVIILTISKAVEQDRTFYRSLNYYCHVHCAEIYISVRIVIKVFPAVDLIIVIWMTKFCRKIVFWKPDQSISTVS